MKIERFISIIGADYFAGVPDSQLKALCNYLMATYGVDGAHHVIAANEGNAVALAAGYHLATGKVPLVYMQNSGEGNIINPVASLLNEKVYGIPMIFVIGWRGEPGVHDEPQHIFQGEVTLKLLEVMDIAYMVVSFGTSESEMDEVMARFRELLEQGKQVAFVIRKGALEFDGKVKYSNDNAMKREEIIRHILDVSGKDPIVSTTGKASRELFELREARHDGHGRDFLTVGSMGHSSSIALGIAQQKVDTRVWCIDGDGAALMHLGSMAVIGMQKPRNLVHIVINNGAHETVGGMPTAAGGISLPEIARACGYEFVQTVSDYNELDQALCKVASLKCLCFIEAKAALGARVDLGRPTTTARDNKIGFMRAFGD